jgi:hypothetical protein
MVIMKLDTKNAFGSLDARLVLDVLSGKTSCDYECDIKSGEDFETEVHELMAYFGFFKPERTCESTLIRWCNELPETQNRRITRRPTRIHGILSCYPSPLGPNFQDVS